MSTIRGTSVNPIDSVSLSKRPWYASKALLIILPMTRTDIGDLLALTIETVSRVFSSLRRERIIDLAQSCEVRIRDMESLERLAKGGGDL